MKTNDFKGISIRGRVAYAICCFENAIMYFNYSISDWGLILEQLWSYTKMEFFDDWHYSTAEFLPESILEFNTDKKDNFECITEEQFAILHKLYNKSSNIILHIIGFIFEIGISEFYGRLDNYGQKTLENLEILVNYMMSWNVPLPDINRFKSLSYEDGNGWGAEFDGRKFSSCYLT